MLFNLPPGDWTGGERGLAALPGREQEFRDGVEKAIDYARCSAARCCTRWPGSGRKGATTRAAARTLSSTTCAGRPTRRRAAGITLLIEPINTRDIPGYFLNTSTQARAIIEAVGRTNLICSSTSITCRSWRAISATQLRRDLPASQPHPDRRHTRPPRAGYRRDQLPYLFDLLDELGYDGWIGCEYRPQGDTLAGLGWAEKYGIGYRHAPHATRQWRQRES